MGHEGEFRYLKVNKGVKWNKCVGRDDNPIIIKGNSEQPEMPKHELGCFEW